MNVEIITEFENNNALQESDKELFMDHLSPVAIQNILHAINQAGYHAHVFGGIPELTKVYSNHLPVDQNAIYLNISNGMTQPSRRMQAPVLCEMLGVNYTGSSPFTVALMNNKFFAKKAVSDLVYTPSGVLLNTNSDIVSKINQIKEYPLIIKPNGEGGSYGIYQDNVVYNRHDALDKAKELLNHYDEVLVEKLIPGTEITNLIIGNKNRYLLNEIVVYKTYGKFEHTALVRDIKIKAHDISEIFPIEEFTKDKALIDRIRQTSVNIFERIGCRDIARIDYKIAPNDKLVFLEINSNPNLYAKYINVICRKNRLTYSDFFRLLIESAASRYNV